MITQSESFPSFDSFPFSDLYYYIHSAVNSVLFHKEDNCIASGSSDKTIKMWDIRSHLLIQHYAAHEAPVTSLSLHPSGYYLLSASRDSTLKIWDLREGRLLFTMQSHVGPINAAQFSRDGHFFASGGTDELVMVWKSNLYGLASPVIDWGMGERPRSAPKITSTTGGYGNGNTGNGAAANVPQEMINTTRSNYCHVTPVKSSSRNIAEDNSNSKWYAGEQRGTSTTPVKYSNTNANTTPVSRRPHSANTPASASSANASMTPTRMRQRQTLNSPVAATPINNNNNNNNNTFPNAMQSPEAMDTNPHPDYSSSSGRYPGPGAGAMNNNNNNNNARLPDNLAKTLEHIIGQVIQCYMLLVDGI